MSWEEGEGVCVLGSVKTRIGGSEGAVVDGRRFGWVWAQHTLFDKLPVA